MTSRAGMSCPVCGTGRTFHVGSGTLRVVEDSPDGVTVEHSVACPVCGRSYTLRTECRAVRTELVGRDGAVLASSEIEARRGVTDATERFKYWLLLPIRMGRAACPAHAKPLGERERRCVDMEYTDRIKLSECDFCHVDRIEPAVVRMHRDEGTGLLALWADSMSHGIDLTEDGARALACALDRFGTSCTLGVGTSAKGDDRDACSVAVTYAYDGTCYMELDIDGESCTFRLSAYARSSISQALVKAFDTAVPGDYVCRHEGYLPGLTEVDE